MLRNERVSSETRYVNAKCTDSATTTRNLRKGQLNRHTRNLRKGQLKPTRDSLTHLREPEHIEPERTPSADFLPCYFCVLHDVCRTWCRTCVYTAQVQATTLSKHQTGQI